MNAVVILDRSGAIRREIVIGDCRLILGDCLEVLPTLGKVDAFVMDPPYNFSTASAGTKHALWADAVNSAFWFSEVLAQCKDRLNVRGGAIWQFLNWRTFIPAQKACWDAGMKFESLLVWDKEWIGPGGPIGLRPSYELVALMATDGFALTDRGLPDIWRHKWSSQRPTGHPAEKPISLIAAIVRETPGALFCDPFMGSGTTGVACAKLGRAFIGIELDEGYFEMACERIRKAYDQPDFFIDRPADEPRQEVLQFMTQERKTP